MDFTIAFIHEFSYGVLLSSPLLLFLILVIVVMGLVVGKIEKWQRFDAIYWAFITASTVGYGDMRPVKKSSRVMSIIVALTGFLFTGILVAIAVQTASMAFKEHIVPNVSRLGML